MAPHPPASPAANTPTLCPQPAGDPLGLPLTPHTLPRPYPDLHRLPSGCNTNHPVPAEREEPPNPPCSFGQGGGLTCAGYPQLPQASRLGQGQGPARGSWGRQGLGDSGIALSRSHFSFLYLGWVLAGDKCPPHGPRCWRLAMGMAGVPLHCRLGWLLFFFFIVR